MIPLSIIKEAFPNQPRMQQAFAATLQQADDLVTSLSGVAEALSKNGGDITAALTSLNQKQPLNSILTEIGALPTDPGVPEQVQPGSWQIRPIDAADTRSLLTRQEADTRYLGGAHAATSATKLATPRNIAITGDLAWSVTFDGSSNVTAAGTIQANAVTFAKFVAATQKALVGANAAGNFQEITLGTGLSLTAGVLTATGSGGTVTTVSVVTANGVSGTVANPSTTPAITLILGAITPSSVAATGAVTGSNLSGTNTGDQTITLTGDATGSGTGSFAVTVGKINGVALSGLATGILKNTTTTGVPSIAVAADFPTLNQNTSGSAAKWTTARNVDGQPLDGSANITVIAPGTHAATSKATPVDADEIPLVDSAASNVLAKLTWANLKATLKTYLDTLYQPIPSAWTAVAFSAGDYTSSAGGSWTVQAGDLLTLKYMIMGKVMTVSFSIFTSTVAGSPAELYFPIPASKTATSRMGNRLGVGIENGVSNSDGSVKVEASGTRLVLFKPSGVGWSNGTDNCYFEGQITFQIN